MNWHNLAELYAAHQFNRGVIDGFLTYDCRIFVISSITDPSSEMSKGIEVMILKIVLNTDIVTDRFGANWRPAKSRIIE